jgi:hypothetical protein
MAEDLKTLMAKINAAKMEKAKQKEEAESKINAEIGEAQEAAGQENALRDKTKVLEQKVSEAELMAQEAEKNIKGAQEILAAGGLDPEDQTALEESVGAEKQKMDELNSIKADLAKIEEQIKLLNQKPETAADNTNPPAESAEGGNDIKPDEIHAALEDIRHAHRDDKYKGDVKDKTTREQMIDELQKEPLKSYSDQYKIGRSKLGEQLLNTLAPDWQQSAQDIVKVEGGTLQSAKDSIIDAFMDRGSFTGPKGPDGKRQHHNIAELFNNLPEEQKKKALKYVAEFLPAFQSEATRIQDLQSKKLALEDMDPNEREFFTAGNQGYAKESYTIDNNGKPRRLDDRADVTGLARTARTLEDISHA